MSDKAGRYAPFISFMLILFACGVLFPPHTSRVLCSQSIGAFGVTGELDPPPDALIHEEVVASNRSNETVPQRNYPVTHDALAPHERYDRIIRVAAERYGIDFYLIKGVIQAESSFNPRAVSPVGASGLMQIMPTTAEMLGVNNRFDPEENILAGVRYLKDLVEALDGDVELALAAYNAGITRIRRTNGVPYRVTRTYVQRVKRFAEEFRSL